MAERREKLFPNGLQKDEALRSPHVVRAFAVGSGHDENDAKGQQHLASDWPTLSCYGASSRPKVAREDRSRCTLSRCALVPFMSGDANGVVPCLSLRHFRVLAVRYTPVRAQF